jgi:hypothetical protein
MHGPRVNPVSDNLPLSTLKRKVVTNKVLARKMKRRIDTVVVNIPDMAGKLADTFEVLAPLTISFSSLHFSLIIVQSSGLNGQPVQIKVADSDRGPVLKPIQEVPADDVLVESSEQPGSNKATENPIDDISIEQPDPQRINASNAPVSQP